MLAVYTLKTHFLMSQLIKYDTSFQISCFFFKQKLGISFISLQKNMHCGTHQSALLSNFY